MSQLTAGEIIWKINGDASGFNKSARGAEKTAKGLGSSWKRAGGLIAGAFATIGLGALVKRFIKAGSDAEEVAQKFGVVFKSVAAEANAMSANLAANYGLSRTEAKRLLSDTGDLLSGFGLTGKASLDLSNKVQMLAADLASFSNVQGGIKFASEALTKGLFGETEQMKSLGIVINQNSAEFKGLVKYYTDVEGKTLLQAKALTILSMATDQSKNAIGDFARSMSSYANQSRIAEANIANLEETIGTKLLPIAGLAVKAFNAVVVELDKSAKSIGDFVSSAKGAKVISNIIGNVAGAFSAAGVLIEPVLKAIKENFQIVIDTVKDIIGPVDDGSSAFTFLAGVLTFAARASKVIVLVLAGIIKALVNMVKIIFTSGKTISSFFMALSGEGKWSDVKNNIISVGGAYKKLGLGVYNDSKKVIAAFGELTGGFTKDTTKLSTDAAKAYGDSKKKFSKAVEDSLLAQNKTKEATKKNAAENKKIIPTIKAKKDAYAGLTGKLRELAIWFDNTEKANAGFTKLLGKVGNIANDAAGFIGGVANALQNMANAEGDKKLAELDAQMQAEIDLAGFAEETQKQKLEKEIAAAKLAGDTAVEIEKTKELERFKIQEKYAKKRAQMEYEIAKMNWEFQLATAIAQAPLTILNAVTAGWVLGPIGAAVYGGLAAAAAGVQIAAVAASMPKPPSFQSGGIVLGSSQSGDNMAAKVNSGEMILNGSQQKKLFDMAQGKSQGGGGNMSIYLGTDMIYKGMYKASKNGDLILDSRSIVSK